MTRYINVLAIFLFAPCALAILFIPLACGEKNLAPPTAKTPTVVSLVPAATDLLVQIGAADHLLGISNYDNARLLGIADLPHVGDYQTIDWERLNSLRPNILIVFEAPDRLPIGLRQRAKAMNIQLFNIHIQTIADIVHETDRLGNLVGEQSKASRAIADFQHRLDALQKKTAHLPCIRTLLIRDLNGIGVVGTGNFLDQALTIAGGENVIQTKGWPDIDEEMLASLNPQAIIILATTQTPQARSVAKSFFQMHPSLSAVKNNRTYIINRWYSQQGSLWLDDIAEQMFADLHGGKVGSGDLGQGTSRAHPNKHLLRAPLLKSRARSKRSGTHEINLSLVPCPLPLFVEVADESL